MKERLAIGFWPIISLTGDTMPRRDDKPNLLINIANDGPADKHTDTIYWEKGNGQ